jgi:hypothetical protein
MIDEPPLKTLLLYFNDRNIIAVFEDKAATLSEDQGNMLRYYLLKSSEKRPATRAAFSSNSNILPNTYTQNVTRLKNKLMEKGFPPLIQTKRYNNETAYYYDGTHPFIIMYRVDEEIEYENAER